MEHLVKFNVSQFMTIITFDKKMPVLFACWLGSGNPNSNFDAAAFALIMSKHRKPKNMSGDFRPYLME